MPVNAENIAGLLNGKLGEGTARLSDIPSNPPCLVIDRNRILDVCKILRDEPTLSFELLECISGIDNGREAGTMEVMYHLCSVSLEFQLALRVILPRPADNEGLTEIDSIASLWGTADWLERETYDLLGISFKGHPDQRRILMPSDWKGYPLRKDYKTEEYFHNVKIDY